MNGRRQVLAALGMAALCSPASLLAQQRTYLVGYLSVSGRPGASGLVDAFRSGMRELGYAEGRNLEIDFRSAEDDLGRLPALAAKLVRRNPDVIVTASPAGVRAAKAATRTIPIVIAAVYDPVGQGFVASLSRPGGNITGLSVQYEDTIPKVIELLTLLIPHLKSIAVLHTVDRSHDSFLVRIREMTARRKIAIQPVEVRAPADLESAFATIRETRSGALIVLPHPLFNARPAAIVRLAGAKRLPAVYPFRNYTEAGGLLSLGVDLRDSSRRAAYFVHRILRGAKPADLPMEQPTKMELVVNLKAAKALDLAVPQSLLVRADQVIE